MHVQNVNDVKLITYSRKTLQKRQLVSITARPHAYMEQLTCQSARQGSQLHRIQKTTENIHVSDGLRHIVTFLIITPYKYFYLLYLLTYLQWS